MPTRGDGWAEVAASVWAFAEAFNFFVVPDVLLTWFAIREGQKPSRLLSLVFVATTAAVAGGFPLFAMALETPHRARQRVVAVPSVSEEMLSEVEASVRTHGPAAVVGGWISGQPFKLYAVAAGTTGQGGGTFVFYSVVARGTRFLLTTFIAYGLTRLIQNVRVTRRVWVATWVLVYAAYWWKHPLW